MDEKAFKKLLIDLDLSLVDVAHSVGVSQWAVTLYFRGNLSAANTRARIKQVLCDRAVVLGITLPSFWEDAAA